MTELPGSLTLSNATGSRGISIPLVEVHRECFVYASMCKEFPK